MRYNAKGIKTKTIKINGFKNLRKFKKELSGPDGRRTGQCNSLKYNMFAD
jgi:hypothetical protein